MSIIHELDVICYDTVLDTYLKRHNITATLVEKEGPNGNEVYNFSGSREDLVNMLDDVFDDITLSEYILD